MSPTTTRKGSANGTAPDRTADQTKALKEHARLVAEYPVQSGAAKAATSAKIGRMEVQMVLPVEFGGLGLIMACEENTPDGQTPAQMVESGSAHFAHWVKPSAYVQKYTTTPEELVSRIQGLRALVARTDLPETVRGNADKQLTQELENASKRGITISEPSSTAGQS